jgi:membrane protein YdbS with pleckstrin-like domain
MTQNEKSNEPPRLSPDPRYQQKLFFNTLLAWGLSSIVLWAIYIPIMRVDEIPVGAPGSIAFLISYAAATVLTWGLAGGLIPPYFRSISYELSEDEVVVRKGIVTKVVKTVPYRTITNTVVKRDLFDRWIFGLGSVLIQTAGMSGTTGYEENLVGLTDWDAAHEQIVTRLRRFRAHAMSPTQTGPEGMRLGAAPGASGTPGRESGAVAGTPLPVGAAELAAQILAELRGIRESLEKRRPG